MKNTSCQNQSGDYLVYILKSDNYSYVGMTNNFFRRYLQHNRVLKGGAKYTSKYENWYPICIIDGFQTMKEAMQCEWAVKHMKKIKYKNGPIRRILNLTELLKKERWTSKSPKMNQQSLTIYIDGEFSHYLENDTFPEKELYWR